MSQQKTDPLTGSPQTTRRVPPHPFFEFSSGQATFAECIDAIDNVGAMIALCEALKLDDNEGLTPNAALGYYWVSVMIRETIAYTSNRLTALNALQQEKYQQKAAVLSALLTTLHTLGSDKRDRFLDNTAGLMNLSRSDLDKAIRKEVKQ